jgi:predicted dehydrogenase
MRPGLGEVSPEAGTPLRIALAGLGFWGQSWVNVVRASPAWALAALVDVDRAARERAAQAAGLTSDVCFATVTEAAAAVALDAVLVVVPPAMHGAVAHSALDSGLHCLVEKPFTETLAEARAVVAHANAAGRIVMVSQQYRQRAGARTVQRLVREGVVGRIGGASIRFANLLPVRGYQHEMDEPLLRDMAIHHFDLVRCVLDVEPVRVTATSHNPVWSDFAGNAVATAVLETPNGAAITYSGTWMPRGALTSWDGAWEILGERGAILWDGEDVFVRGLDRSSTSRIWHRLTGRDWRGRRVRVERLAAADRAGSLTELAAAIHEQRQPETSGRDNLRSLALTVAAVESARRRAAVEVAEVLAAEP